MPTSPDSTALVAQLRAILSLDPAGDDVFRTATYSETGGMGYGRVFGGQVIAQALLAATATVPPDRHAHSLHAYFLRMGAEGERIDYAVSREYDGGAYSNRRIVADQGARRLLTMSASFHRREQGLRHRDAMPDVPAPERVIPDSELRLANSDLFIPEHRAVLGMARPVELRTVELAEVIHGAARPPLGHVWMRTVAPLGDDQALHRAVLAYMTDMVMLPTAMLPHGVSGMRGEVQEASLDHAVWFHSDVRADDWLLVQTRSGWADNGRAHITARVFSRAGEMVASVAQEGTIRAAR